MYGLVRGNLALSIAPGERGPYVAHFAQPGTWFGEAAAFTEQPRRIGLCGDARYGGAASAVARHPGDRRRSIRARGGFSGLAAIAHNDVAIGAADDLLIRDT